jgi:hypothetical protein
MLFNAGVWWDDWALYNMSREGLNEMFTGNGGFYMAPIHDFLQNISPYPWIPYRFLTFILYFATSVLLYYILPYLKIEQNNRFILTALYTVLPINIARISMICFPYTLGIVFCFTALYCFTVAFYKKQLLFRVLSLIFCVLAFFFLASNFVFIPAYIAFLIFLNGINFKKSTTQNIRLLPKQILKYTDFIVLTIAVWVCIKVFFQPTGLYAQSNYNFISLKAIIISPFKLLVAFMDTVFYTVNFTNEIFMNLMFIPVLLLLLYVLRNKTVYSDIKTPILNIICWKKNIKISVFVLLGLYFYIAGALAYVFVNKVPISWGFGSRHQILLGIGTALFLTGIVNIFMQKKYMKYVFILLLSTCVTANINNCFVYQGLHYKNLAIMTEIKKQKNIFAGKNFMVLDNAAVLYDRDIISFYAFQGMAKKVLGNETNFITDRFSLNSMLKIGVDAFKKSMYNMKDITFNGVFDYYLVIEKGEIELGRTHILKLMIEEYFFKDQFVRDIDDILTIKCIPYQANQAK